MGRRKCSSFPACFVGDDSLVLFTCLLFYVDEEQRDSPSQQVSWGFFLESFFLFVPMLRCNFFVAPCMYSSCPCVCSSVFLVFSLLLLWLHVLMFHNRLFSLRSRRL
jgi:hypothetical protein